ncbi:MAG: hypothetical protein QM804_08840 [Propionicimonas sp.]
MPTELSEEPLDLEDRDAWSLAFDHEDTPLGGDNHPSTAHHKAIRTRIHLFDLTSSGVVDKWQLLGISGDKTKRQSALGLNAVGDRDRVGPDCEPQTVRICTHELLEEPRVRHEFLARRPGVDMAVDAVRLHRADNWCHNYPLIRIHKRVSGALFRMASAAGEESCKNAVASLALSHRSTDCSTSAPCGNPAARLWRISDQPNASARDR